jgi:primosomal protein N' (replication factor Y)
MASPKIAKISVGLPVEGPFDYSIPEAWQTMIAPGMRVTVSFNRRKRLGYVVGLAQRSAFKRLNPVLELLDEQPVMDARQMSLARAMSHHYGCSLGEAIETMLPRFLRQRKMYDGGLNERDRPRGERKPECVLLTDQTSHQRWTVLTQRIQAALARGTQVLILVPETHMIPHVKDRLEPLVDGPVVAQRPKASVAHEKELWRKMTAGGPQIVIGTRSAVFAPVWPLGLMIVLDEENTSYKQEQSPYYHAVTIARMRQRAEQCDLILVSAAPSAETWHTCKGKHKDRVRIQPDRVSDMKLVDLTNYNPRKTSKFSFPLQISMEKTLNEGGKVLLFMNRKGFFTVTRCQDCGFVLKCPRCDVNLTYHFAPKQMVCKHCGYAQGLPKFCPSCQKAYLQSRGIGAEKLKSEAARLYPQCRIASFDKDSRAYPRQADIVIATQAVLGVQGEIDADLIGVISFDAEMNYFDFRAGQRAYALLVKLRQMAKQTLLVQTTMMDNYILKAVLKGDDRAFYRQELQFRKEVGLPPFKQLIYIISRGKDQDAVAEYSRAVAGALEALIQGREPKAADTVLTKGVEVTDSHPDVHPKLRDQYRFTIMLKGPRIRSIMTLAKLAVKRVRTRKKIITAIKVDA